MATITLQITYRKGKPLAAYLYLGKKPGQKSARTEKVTESLLLDYGEDGAPIGVEIVSPSAVSIEEINAVFDQLGFQRPLPAELEPLRAA